MRIVVGGLNLNIDPKLKFLAMVEPHRILFEIRLNILKQDTSRKNEISVLHIGD